MAGYLVMTADDDSIEIGTRTNSAGIVHQVNQLWFTVQRRTWAIVYSAAYGRIEFRARTRMGRRSPHSVDKTTPGAQVGAVFAAL